MDVPEKGKGVVTLVSVEKDDLICEYCGELMTHKRVKEREENYLKKSSSSYEGYIFFFEYQGNKFWYVESIYVNLRNMITVYYYTVLMQQLMTKIDQVDLLIIRNYSKT